MLQKHVIWITGPSAAGSDALGTMLEQQPDLEVRRQVQTGRHLDASGFGEAPPRLVLLDLGNQGAQLLQDWVALPEAARAPLIVVGPSHDSQLMRRAMQTGARDFFTHPVPADELLASVRQILREAKLAPDAPGGKLTAVIDAKGGSGASFIISGPVNSRMCISHQVRARSCVHPSHVRHAHAIRNSSSAFCGRRLGSFCRQAMTRSSSSRGIGNSVRCEGGTGVACRCCISMCIGVSASKTSCPVSK